MTQTPFDPMLSVFDSAEEEAQHTAWLRAKVQASLDDPRPSIPHEQVMAEMRERLARLRERQSQSKQRLSTEPARRGTVARPHEQNRPESVMTSTPLDPFVSEFETEEQEAEYTAWLRAKVAASLADPRPMIPHDQVMAEIDAIIDAAEARQRAGLVA